MESKLEPTNEKLGPVNVPGDITTWERDYLLHEHRALLRMQGTALNTIEELQQHGRDIQTVVKFLHAHMPERFDPSGRQTMGELMVGICRDYLLLRDRSWPERLWRLLERRAEARRLRKRERLHEFDEED